MWLAGVVSRKWVWLVGGIYGCGYNVLVWLVGVVVRSIEVLILLIPTPLVLALFFASSIPTSLFIFKMFFILVYQTLPEEHSRLFKNRDHVDMVI